MEELVNQINYNRKAKIIYVLGIILYLINLVVGAYFLLLSIVLSSGCCQNLISYQFRNIVICTISFIIIIPFLKKRNCLFIIPIILALIFLNDIYFYITSPDTTFYSYLQILYNIGFYVGLFLLWLSNGLYFQNNTKRSKLIIPALIVIAIITFLLIPSVRSYYWNTRNTAFEKKVYSSMKDIYIPNGLKLPTPEISYPNSNSMSNTRGGYIIAMDVKDCPTIDEDWFSKNSWRPYVGFANPSISILSSSIVKEGIKLKFEANVKNSNKEDLQYINLNRVVKYDWSISKRAGDPHDGSINYPTPINKSSTEKPSFEYTFNKNGVYQVGATAYDNSNRSIRMDADFYIDTKSGAEMVGDIYGITYLKDQWSDLSELRYGCTNAFDYTINATGKSAKFFIRVSF